MKIFGLFIEPANYTMDAIKNVHSKVGVDYAFINGSSNANIDIIIDVPILSKLTNFGLLKYIWHTLKNYDAFIINGYTDRTCLTFLLLDILFFKKPYAIDSDTELHIPANPIKRLIKKAFLKIIFGRKYAYGFAGGYFEHIKLFTHYGMDSGRVFVDPMTVDNEKYSRAVVPDPKGCFKFGYLGRLVSVKQVDMIVAAVKRLIDEGYNIELDIVGNGELKHELESLAEGHAGIRFLGAKFGDDKIAALHTFDALVLNSSYEPWGLVVNEALAAGIPCIVSDKVGARNDLILGDDPTGLVVPYDDVEALADAMKKLATDRALWKRLSAAALKRMARWNYDMQRDNLRQWMEKIA